MSYWIVVVDDEPISLTNAKNLLSTQNIKVSCLRSGRDLLKFVQKNEPDLILLDILMPEMDGFETYRALRELEDQEKKQHIPVIFLTGENNKETERRGLKAGASDFIHKPFDRDILVKRIKNTIKNSRMIESLTEEANYDKLTGFLNKTSGTERAKQMCASSNGALMIFDLDNFKLVNDLYGHDMGDSVLVAFSDIVRRNIRNEDMVSRIGGDEFLGFFADVNSEDSVASLSQRLNEQLMEKADELMGSEHGIPLGISVGAAFAPEHSSDYQILFRFADSTLYNVKQNGKHGYGIYSHEEKSIEDGPEDLEGELLRVTKILEERGSAKGAQLLGQEAFSWNYRFIIRFVKRHGTFANRILFSLTSNEKGPIFSEMMAEFSTILQHSLRLSDIILQSRTNQFFVVLPNLSETDCPKVIDRIMTAWENTGYSERVKIQSVSSIVRSEDFEDNR